MSQILDLASLKPGPTGRQNDARVRWPADFEMLGAVVVPVIQERNGDLFFLDPEGLREGVAEVHPMLYAFAAMGTITDRKSLEKLARDVIRKRLAEGLSRAVIELGTALPAEARQSALTLVALVLKALLGR